MRILLVELRVGEDASSITTALPLTTSLQPQVHASVPSSQAPAENEDELQDKHRRTRRSSVVRASSQSDRSGSTSSCDATGIKNPVFTLREGRVRDPAVWPLPRGEAR